MYVGVKEGPDPVTIDSCISTWHSSSGEVDMPPFDHRRPAVTGTVVSFDAFHLPPMLSCTHDEGSRTRIEAAASHLRAL